MTVCYQFGLATICTGPTLSVNLFSVSSKTPFKRKTLANRQVSSKSGLRVHPPSGPHSAVPPSESKWPKQPLQRRGQGSPGLQRWSTDPSIQLRILAKCWAVLLWGWFLLSKCQLLCFRQTWTQGAHIVRRGGKNYNTFEGTVCWI